MPIDYYKAGAMLADWAIVKTKGKLNALTLIASGALSTDSMTAGINAELKNCPDCKQKVMNYPVTDWATRITPGVQAALLADPKVNYIIVIYDSMAQFVVPAVTVTGSTDRVKIDAFNGNALCVRASCKRDRSRWTSARTSTGSAIPSWIPKCAASAVCRLVSDPKIPFYIFTAANAKDAGTPPQLSKGYGNAYEKGSPRSLGF